MLVAWSCIRSASIPYNPHLMLTLLIGSVPFLLREHLSYSQLAIFSLASYPYSLKLFWSPIVDSKFLPSIGRRKSWIIPMQLIIGTIMFAMSFHAEKLIQNVRSPVHSHRERGSDRPYHSRRMIYIFCQLHSLGWFFSQPRKVRRISYVGR